MDGKIVELTWKPGSNTSSSRGANKYDIQRKMSSANKIIDNGFGNYNLIEYSSYYAKIILSDGSVVRWDIKRYIKDKLKISKMTASEREKIEKLLPIEVDFKDKILTFTDSRLIK